MRFFSPGVVQVAFGSSGVASSGYPAAGKWSRAAARGLSRSVSAAYRPRAATRDEFECLPLDGPSPCLTPPNAKHEFFHFDDFFTDWKYSSNSDSS